ncbi:MAG: formylglycine-generating enzyme family protein [Pirellulales bacterium]
MRRKLDRVFLLAACVLLATGTAQAVTIDLVPVGNPGNVGELSGAGAGGGGYGPDVIVGAVDHVYQIGKYEVTNAQWREFLGAKAAVGDPYGLYSSNMAGTYGGIARSGSGTVADPYLYTAKGGDSNWDNRPVNFVSLWDAARFANWLHNGQGDGDTETGAYINIGNQTTFARQAGAKWWIPSEDEWYKAAYHKNDGATGNYWDYPTGTNSVPSNDLLNPDPGNNANFSKSGYTIDDPYCSTLVGEFENSESPYGTFDQGGDLWEWNETAIFGWSRGLRGGGWGDYSSRYLRASARYDGNPAGEDAYVGFRVASVASVPEPGSITLLLCGAVTVLMWWRCRK